MRRSVDLFRPNIVIGIGAFAEQRTKIALKEWKVSVGGITHPSPANPKANKGWSGIIEKELRNMGIKSNGVFL